MEIPWYKRWLRFIYNYVFNPIWLGIFYGSGYFIGSMVYRYARKWIESKL